jgi:hypothetical protein
MTEGKEMKPVSAIERHIQTMLAVIVSSILLWVGNTVSGSREEIVRLQEQVSSMQSRLDVVNEMDRRLSALEMRVGIIENKVTMQ